MKTEPGAGASPLEFFCSRQDSALGNFGTCRGWWQGWRGTSLPGCCTAWKAQTNLSLPPSHPLPLQGSEKQLEGTGWWERQQDPHVEPGKRRGWGINMARGGISVRCRQGLTLPLGLLHAGVSPRDSCHPSIPLGCGLGYTFTSLCFSVTFLGAFAIV